MAWRQGAISRADFDGNLKAPTAQFLFGGKLWLNKSGFWSFGWVFFPKHHIETIRKTSPKKQLMRKVGPNPVTPKK